MQVYVSFNCKSKIRFFVEIVLIQNNKNVEMRNVFWQDGYKLFYQFVFFFHCIPQAIPDFRIHLFQLFK